jgi:hypothetical protein
MSLAAIPRLLPPPQMARGMPDAYSCEVRRLLMAQKMLRGDRILVIFFGRVHNVDPAETRAPFAGSPTDEYCTYIRC